jgi:hypothetical protein
MVGRSLGSKGCFPNDHAQWLLEANTGIRILCCTKPIPLTIKVLNWQSFRTGQVISCIPPINTALHICNVFGVGSHNVYLGYMRRPPNKIKFSKTNISKCNNSQNIWDCDALCTEYSARYIYRLIKHIDIDMWKKLL